MHEKSVKKLLPHVAVAMMLSAAQISAFADRDVKEVSLHLPTVYDLPDAPMVEDTINQITKENGIHLNRHMYNRQLAAAVKSSVYGDEADVIAVFMTPLAVM